VLDLHLFGFFVKFAPAMTSSACTSKASAVSATRQSPASFSSGLSPSTTTTTLVSETRSSSSDRFLTCDGDDDDPFMVLETVEDEDEETNSGETHSEGKDNNNKQACKQAGNRQC
jgi:hypothetical protein